MSILKSRKEKAQKIRLLPRQKIRQFWGGPPSFHHVGYHHNPAPRRQDLLRGGRGEEEGRRGRGALRPVLPDCAEHRPSAGRGAKLIVITAQSVKDVNVPFLHSHLAFPNKAYIKSNRHSNLEFTREPGIFFMKLEVRVIVIKKLPRFY